MGRVGGEQTKAEQTIIGGGRVSSCKEGSATAFSGLFAKKLRNERLRCRLQQIARAERWVTLIRPVDVGNIMGLILFLFGTLLVGNSKAQDGPLVSCDLILPHICHGNAETPHVFLFYGETRQFVTFSFILKMKNIPLCSFLRVQSGQYERWEAWTRQGRL